MKTNFNHLFPSISTEIFKDCKLCNFKAANIQVQNNNYRNILRILIAILLSTVLSSSFLMASQVISRISGNWSAHPWRYTIRSGTISTIANSYEVVGVDTQFTSEICPGDSIFDGGGDVKIGKVASVIDDTRLILNSVSEINLSSQPFKSNGVGPGDLVIIYNKCGITIDIPDAKCAGLTIGGNTTYGGLNFTSAGVLLVAGVVTFTIKGTDQYSNTFSMSNGGKLTCKGLTLESGRLSWTPGNGTIELTGNNTLPSSVFTTFYNLIIRGGVTTLATNTTVSSTLTIQPEGALTIPSVIRLANNLPLIINSGPEHSGSLINNGTVSGTIIYNRYLEGERWYIISSPVKNAPTEDIVNIDKVGVDDITNTFDFAYLNEPTNQWIYSPVFPVSPNIFSSGIGYLMKVKGSGLQAFTGTVNNSEVSPAVTFTLPDKGWNAVGNPFTSAIKITGTTANTFLGRNSAVLDPSYGAIYVWEEGESYKGTQQYYKPIGNSGYREPGMGTLTCTTIQAGQGFLVNSGTTTGTIIFTGGGSGDGMQVHSPDMSLKSTEPSWPGVTLKALLNGNICSTIVAFNSGMTNGLDKTFDVGMLSQADFNIYTRMVDGSNKVNFAIQCLPENQFNELEVPIGLDIPAKGSFTVTFKATGVILPEGLFPEIEDRFYHTFTPLKTEEDVYTVNLDAGSSGIGRFYLHIRGSEGSVGKIDQVKAKKYLAYYENQRILIFGSSDQGSKAWLYDISGRIVGGVYNLTSNHQNDIPAVGLRSGIYLLKIEERNSMQVIKVPVLQR